MGEVDSLRQDNRQLQDGVLERMSVQEGSGSSSLGSSSSRDGVENMPRTTFTSGSGKGRNLSAIGLDEIDAIPHEDAHEQPDNMEDGTRVPSKRRRGRGWQKVRNNVRAVSAFDSLLRGVRKCQPDETEGDLSGSSAIQAGKHFGIKLKPAASRKNNRRKLSVPNNLPRRKTSERVVMPWGGVGVGTCHLEATISEWSSSTVSYV